MILAHAQERATNFWRSKRKKVGTFQGPLKQMMLRGAHGKSCRICGNEMVYFPNALIDHTMPNAATIEHILPRSLGGTHENDNITTICNGCNRARGMVYSDIVRSEEVVRMYVGWLFSQIEDPIQSGHDYPLFESHFARRWEELYNETYQPAKNRVRITRNRKRRLLDMSANARMRRPKGGLR
ncbi:MAG: hypothetical protein CMB26_03510 [Euryarchaeota archaeon]|nr:hypothetical protein [Euryarchaeota archaeon]